MTTAYVASSSTFRAGGVLEVTFTGALAKSRGGYLRIRKSGQDPVLLCSDGNPEIAMGFEEHAGAVANGDGRLLRFGASGDVAGVARIREGPTHVRGVYAPKQHDDIP